VVPYDIRELLGFQKGAPEQVDVHGVTLEVFLEYDHGKKPSTKKYYPEPHHPSVSLMDVQKDFGENERNKGNRHGVDLALIGFDCQVANRPHSPMINRWCCGNIEFGRYWFGVLPLHVGYLFKTGYYKEPESSPTRDFPRI
jgi:hypothetical protein